MENEPRGQEHQFVSSTGLRAEELLAATGEIPVQPAKRVEVEPEPEKKSDPKYIAEVRLMKRSMDFLREKKHLRSELESGVEPGEPTLESSLREAYEDGAGLDTRQTLFAHVLINSGRERLQEQMLAAKPDSLTPGQITALKRGKAYYRAELRKVIEDSEGGITQDDMSAWLGHFGKSAEWAERVVQEEAAKVALYGYLSQRRDLSVKYASPDESAAGGYDLDVTPYHDVLGGPMKIKTKPVGASEGDVRTRQGVVELEIPKSKVEDFEFTDANDAQELATLMSKAARGTNLAYSTESRHG